MPILPILVALLLLCVVIWAALRLLQAFQIPDPLHSVILVVIVVLGVLAILSSVGVPLPLRWR